MPTRFDAPFWIGDRYFSEDDIQVLRETLRRFHRLSRGELVATLCENLPWVAPNGRPRMDACRALLQAIEDARWMPVPPKKASSSHRTASAERQGQPLTNPPIRAPLAALQPITVTPVSAMDEPIWNATMATYHPLGFQRAFGARQRYWIESQAGTEPIRLGGLLFATAAAKLQDRDRWIGWDVSTRAQFRARIVNNSRFLILPDIQVPHLASHVLALAARRIRSDWEAQYGFAPVLLETFVEAPWAGTCYAAANWHRIGTTQGMGRQAIHHQVTLPRKTIWMYPLVRSWRTALTKPWPTRKPVEDAGE